jgi:hypothetical protein
MEPTQTDIQNALRILTRVMAPIETLTMVSGDLLTLNNEDMIYRTQDLAEVLAERRR